MFRSFGVTSLILATFMAGLRDQPHPGMAIDLAICFIRGFRNISERLTADDAGQMMARSADLNHLPIRVSPRPGPPVVSRSLVACPAFTQEGTLR
jgi:hypothetical protein